ARIARCWSGVRPTASSGASKIAASKIKVTVMPLLSQRSVAAGSLVDTDDDAMLPVILEFSSPSAAIIAWKGPLLARGTVWAIGALFAACLLAMWLIPVDRVVTARGTIASRVPTIIVQPLETSIVRAIDVTEGERVHAGDLLA